MCLFLRFAGSETEERDIRKAYLAGKGCINYMMDSVPFMTVEDEPRISGIVQSKCIGYQCAVEGVAWFVDTHTHTLFRFGLRRMD